MASNITTLVEKAKQGDADAFSTLYQMYYPKMKGICINILREDKAVVDDLVQDAFILIIIKRLENEENIYHEHYNHAIKPVFLSGAK